MEAPLLEEDDQDAFFALMVLLPSQPPVLRVAESNSKVIFCFFFLSSEFYLVPPIGRNQEKFSKLGCLKYVACKFIPQKNGKSEERKM